ncbi:MAG TPA: hypothetical protein VHP63_02200 [candidate division Zixibacteria bacterium]|nr:hypothetical protein [candidate division Zixibacteria bacterium]
MKQLTKSPDTRIRQGDIFSDVEYFVDINDDGVEARIRTIKFPLSVVLTQDCDLLWDNLRRVEKKGLTDNAILISILLAPLYNFEYFKSGVHLEKLNLTADNNWRKTRLEDLIKNKNPRYHYLDTSDEDVSIVSSVVDFKHYFSVRQDYLEANYKNAFRGSLNQLFREDLSQRFTSFLSRIALPTEQQQISN